MIDSIKSRAFSQHFRWKPAERLQTAPVAAVGSNALKTRFIMESKRVQQCIMETAAITETNITAQLQLSNDDNKSQLMRVEEEELQKLPPLEEEEPPKGRHADE